MKTPLVPLLVLSLAGNAALAFFVLRSPASSTPAAHAAAVTPAASAAVTAGPAPAAAPIDWKTMKPDRNLHTLVANLRAAGFPPSVVRAVASQLVSDQLDSSAMDHLPFWKKNPNNPEYLAAQQELSGQRRDMIKDLLGADARPSAMMDAATRERRFGQLPDDKVDQIENITRDYNDLRSKLYASRKSGDMTGTMSAQAAAEQEQHAELASVLSPAELEQYEMRSSSSASKLMGALKDLDVNEAEYTALFRAQKSFDAADPARAGVMTADAMAQRNAAQDQLNEQARAVLPDDRFYEYLKGSDFNYARAAQFTANYPSITPAMTYDLTRIEREYQASTLALARSGNGGAPSTDRMAQMMAARKDYQEKLNALLGPEAATAYAQRNRTGVVTQTVRSGPSG
jgi:hypothetical protein